MPRITKGLYTLGDKLQQHVAVTDHSVCRARATVVSETRWGDTSQQQIASCVLENFCENLFPQQNFVAAKVEKIKSDWSCATCCGDKFLLQRQRFSQKFSSANGVFCRCNVSLRPVAATCRLVRTDLTLDFIWLCHSHYTVALHSFAPSQKSRQNHHSHP